jgi:hypothetical protein
MVYENSPHPVVRDRLIAGDEEKRPARHLQETTEHFGRFVLGKQFRTLDVDLGRL